MKQGTVIRMVHGKNFGFIRCMDTEYFFHRDHFVGHWADLELDFSNGKEIRVQFDEAPPKENNKGPRASNVSRLDYPNQAVTERDDTTLCSMGPDEELRRQSERV